MDGWTSCPVCLNIPRREEISDPKQLTAVIERTRRYVAEIRLHEVAHPQCPKLPWTQPAFDVLPADGPWDDILLYRFSCSLCGARFDLHADTYHGRASWERVPELRAGTRAGRG